MPESDVSATRVLVLAPTGRDASLVVSVLAKAGICADACHDFATLVSQLNDADTAILAEEALGDEAVELLGQALAHQPVWSDIPLIILGAPHSTSAVTLFSRLSPSANLTLIERPSSPFTLVTVTLAAIRARRRQHITRVHMDELVAAKEEIARQRDERDTLLNSERAARTEVERAGRMKDEFLSTLGHELRTPLNAISGWVQLLRRGNLSPADQAKAYETIGRNTRAQTELIEDLLDMSRIISGKVRLDIQTVDLSALIAGAVDSVQPTAQAKGITLDHILDPLPGPIVCDPARLQQVLWNLISNAVKFTPRGGRVRVTLERIDSRVEISVSDSGIGIGPAFLPYVFDRFRQVDASSTRHHGGLGLGLAIVKQLVEMHGGRVRASSLGEGHGSTFTVSLPVRTLAAPGPRGANPAAVPRELPTFSPLVLVGTTILVVDDDADGRYVVQRLLEESSAKVLTADSVENALAILTSRDVDVMISDIGMPGRDGYDLIRCVRASQSPRLQRLPAAALTAFARSEDRTRALRAGYDSHVSKPVEPSELMAVIERLKRKGAAGAPVAPRGSAGA